MVGTFFVFDLVSGALDYFGEILNKLLVLRQVCAGKSEGLVVDFNSLLKPFEVFKLNSHVVVCNCEYCQSLIINLNLMLLLLFSIEGKIH